MSNGKKRLVYDETFKRQTVKKLLKSGKTVSVFAISSGINRTNLQKWKKIYSSEFTRPADDSDGKTVGFHEYLALKKEFASLKETVEDLRAVVKKNFENKYSDG